MNRPAKDTLRNVLSRFVVVAALFGLGATLAACESGLECRPVTVNGGCEARCAKVIEKDGKQLMCTDMLLVNATGENAILQRKTKKVTTRKLDGEVCFPVKDRKVADEAIRKQLGTLCAGP